MERPCPGNFSMGEPRYGECFISVDVDSVIEYMEGRMIGKEEFRALKKILQNEFIWGELGNIIHDREFGELNDDKRINKDETTRKAKSQYDQRINSAERASYSFDKSICRGCYNICRW